MKSDQEKLESKQVRLDNEQEKPGSKKMRRDLEK